MRFLHPELLWLILALPVLGLAAWGSRVRRLRMLERFGRAGDTRLRFDGEVSINRRLVKALLIQFALACVIVAVSMSSSATFRRCPVTTATGRGSPSSWRRRATCKCSWSSCVLSKTLLFRLREMG